MRVKLSKKQKDIIGKYVDENKSLTCIKAVKISKLINVDIGDMASIAKSIDIKIIKCELGAFGDVEFTGRDNKTYEDLKHLSNKKQIDCKIAWAYAQKKTLRNVGATIRNSDLKAVNCQLGCFKLRDGHGGMMGRAKVWIEDDSENLLFGSGKLQILELIEQTGSISQAAKKIGLNYKKAWSHIKILQDVLEDDLILPARGGKGKGGSTLTPKAKEVMTTFNQWQEDVKRYTKRRYKELFIKENDTLLHSKEQNA